MVTQARSSINTQPASSTPPQAHHPAPDVAPPSKALRQLPRILRLLSRGLRLPQPVGALLGFEGPPEEHQPTVVTTNDLRPPEGSPPARSGSPPGRPPPSRLQPQAQPGRCSSYSGQKFRAPQACHFCGRGGILPFRRRGSVSSQSGGAFFALAASFRGIRWRCHGRCGGDDGDLGCGLCRRRTGRRGLLDLGRRR